MMMMIREKEKERPYNISHFRDATVHPPLALPQRRGRVFGLKTKVTKCELRHRQECEHQKHHNDAQCEQCDHQNTMVCILLKRATPLPSSARVTKTTRARRDNNLSSFAHLSPLFHLEHNLHLAYQDCVSFVHILHRAWKYVWFFVHCVHCSRHEIISKPSEGTLQQC